MVTEIFLITFIEICVILTIILIFFMPIIKGIKFLIMVIDFFIHEYLMRFFK